MSQALEQRHLKLAESPQLLRQSRRGEKQCALSESDKRGRRCETGGGRGEMGKKLQMAKARFFGALSLSSFPFLARCRK